MSIRGTWKRFKLDIARMRQMDAEIRDCSDQAYSKVYGRYGTDAERDAFHRKFKQMLRQDAKQREQRELADMNAELSELRAKTNKFQMDIENARLDIARVSQSESTPDTHSNPLH